MIQVNLSSFFLLSGIQLQNSSATPTQSQLETYIMPPPPCRLRIDIANLLTLSHSQGKDDNKLKEIITEEHLQLQNLAAQNQLETSLFKEVSRFIQSL